MQDLRITIIQSPLHWENIEKNLDMFSEKILNFKDDTDLIVVPEMFTTGFTMNPEKVAEEVNGITMQWMNKLSIKKKCVITGSIVIKENGKYYNRLIWQKPDGTNETYNKRHLFRFAHEQEKYTAGNKKLIAEINNDWKICPMICYDLRFPVWIRNRINSRLPSSVFRLPTSDFHLPSSDFRLPTSDYDILIFVANWPERRSHPWKTLLQARAMENQCYVVGVNRIGTDANNISYSGDSMIINPLGEIISKTKANEESVETVTLSKQILDNWRKTFPAWMDADEFKLY